MRILEVEPGPKQYVDDPRGLLGPNPPSQPVADIPSDADVSYQVGPLRVFVSSSDPEAVVVRENGELRRWPRLKVGCG